MATIQQPLQVAPSGRPEQLWGGTSPGTSILIYNQDLTNTLYIGYVNAIKINGVNTIPVAPNAFWPIDGGTQIWAIGTQGMAPTVVVPGGCPSRFNSRARRASPSVCSVT